MQRKKLELTVIPQKTYYGSNTDKHGARLDVYLEEADDTWPGGATVYDIEPDQNDKLQNKKALPKRTRFYHAKIDAASLKSGEDYRCLKNVIVLMIMPYDPFTLNRMVYTIQNGCVEAPEMPYDDGARTLYLYTRGTEGNPPGKLQQLLHYMEHTTEENAQNDSLRGIQKMVEEIKHDGEVSLEYMKIFEREKMLIDEGFERGQAQERANTEREKQRADAAETKAAAAEQEILRLKQELQKLRIQTEPSK
ncbi:MAG: hypothetical protein Q4C61_16075 [Lachnospiraceae bacterium]|nr:hypothetical protein [Lachnospiraceae bacterium]